METGFVKASSDNIPSVTVDMIHEWYVENPLFISAEIRHGKTKRVTRDSYGDNAVAYVQLKREGDTCIIKGKITPEHKVHKKAYNVLVEINEKDSVVLQCKCLDCSAAEGGCKHGVAFLFWIHRRSEEPSVTSQECYWKKSALSQVGSRHDFADLNAICGRECPKLSRASSTVAKEFVALCPPLSGGLFDMFSEPQYANASIFQNFIAYKNTFFSHFPGVEDFVDFLKTKLTSQTCKEVEEATREQSGSPLWFEMRYARITASIIYDVVRCKTYEGSLTEKIMGAQVPFETTATLRGKNLESFVLKEVAKIKNINISRSGILLHWDYPIFGASPDGVSSEYVVEVKCPVKEDTVKTYVNNNIIQKKYMYQVQLQMMFANKSKALFCVASPDFERSKEVSIYEIEIDKDLCREIIEAASVFWKNAIYPLLSKM